MMDLILYTRLYAEATKSDANTKAKNGFKLPASTSRIGTLSISIPTRKLRVDKKGRKRRLAFKISEPLLGNGGGGLTAKAAMANLAKDLKGIRPKVLNPKNYRKIIMAMAPDK